MNLSQSSSSIDSSALSSSQLQLNIANLSNLTGQLDPNLLQQQMLQQQMFQMQQRAFLASTMQQNLEIQKQLLQQNQQLQQLLAQPVPPASSSTPGADQQQQQQAMNRSTSLSSLAYPLPTTNSMMSPSAMVAAFQQQHTNGSKANEPNVMSPTSAGKTEKSASTTQPAAKISIVSNGGIKMIPPPPPPPPPPLSPGTDVFGRAKTVRIGKWRWPPLSEEVGAAAPGSNFIEFKRKKQIEKKMGNNSTSESSDAGVNVNGGPVRSSVSSSDQSFTNGTGSSESSPMNGNSTTELQLQPPLKPATEKVIVLEASKRSASIAAPSNGIGASVAPPKEHISRKYSDNVIAPGSIGKLRISTEMRAKLEQLTIDQSVRGPTSRERRERVDVRGGKEGGGVVTSQSMDDLANMSSVKKLSETRKALLERQLMGSLRNAAHNFMETASTPNIKQTVDSVVAAAAVGVVVVGSDHSHHHHHGHKKLSQESSLNSNYEPSLHVKKFIKNQQNLLRKSGSREFRERRDELGPFNRLSSSTSHVNSYGAVERPLYTPERFFNKDDAHVDHHNNHNHHHHHQSFDADSHSAESSNERHSSSSGPFNGYNGHFSSKANGFSSNLKRMNIPPPPPPNGDTSSLNGQLMINGNGLTQHHLKGHRGHPSGRSYRDSGHFEPLEFPDSQADYLKSMNGSEQQLHNGLSDQHLEVERQIKTKLYLKNEINFYAYSKPKFKLNLRKEVCEFVVIFSNIFYNCFLLFYSSSHPVKLWTTLFL